MPHRLMVLVFVALAGALFPSFKVRAADDAAPRPNIVFIIADDMGFADVSFRGSPIKTPALDALAAGGAVLEQHYVQPVCSPTRAAFLTGRYPMRHGLQVGVVRPWAEYGLPLEEQTLAQGLKSAGYQTAIVGKWHLGHFKPEYLPTRRGFDQQYGHYNGALDFDTKIRDGGYDWHKNDQVNRDEGYSTHLLGREAVRVINERDKSRPLFLYVPFNAVHSPYMVPAKYEEPYANLAGKRKTYAGMLAAMDEAIGQIVAALDANGLRKETLIVFSSDNGGPQPGRITDNGQLRAGKGTVYEGGTRVIALAAWEGKIPAQSSVNGVIHIVDWYPTLLKLAGAKVEQKQPIDGVDVWATLSANAPSPRKEMLYNTAPNRGAIRIGDWKLVVGGNVPEGDGPGDAGDADTPPNRPNRRAAQPDQVELFDLANDPYEKKNLAAENPEKVKALRTRYDQLASQAVTPRSKPKPKDFKTPAVWGE